MRHILLIAFGLLPFVASSQATIISDDFESYNSGDLLAATSALWDTWPVTGEDAYVSSAQASGGLNSVHLSDTSYISDLVLPFPSDYTSGVYEFSLKMYIVSGNGGYFNIQESSVPGVDWMFEIYFDDAGGGFINAGGMNAATVSYTPDTWTSINVLVDLNNDQAELFINSHSVYSWQWSLGAQGTTFVNMIGGVNIYTSAASGSSADFYVDNVLLEEKTTTGIIVDDFERYAGGDSLAVTSDVWTTWSGGIPGEDALVSNTHGSSGFNSVHIIGNTGPTDLILPFPFDYTSGVYEYSMKMFVVSGKGAYFNIQQSSVPNVAYMLDMYFGDAGGGHIDAGGINSATFSYTPDSWTTVLVKADLTNDIGECYINNNLIHTWQWSTGSSGLESVAGIGGVDIFAYAEDAADADFYVDDVLLRTAFPTGITAGSSGSDILVAPNPSSGHFSVLAADLPAGSYQIQLTDVLGNLISSETLNVSGSIKKEYSVDLASGIYYVRFTSGNKVSTRKIVIN